MNLRALILFGCMFQLAFASADKQFDYAMARFKAAKSGVPSRIQRNELSMAQKDFERFVAEYPKDVRRVEAERILQEILKNLASESSAVSTLQAINLEHEGARVLLRLSPSRNTTFTANHVGEDLAAKLPARVYVDLHHVEGLKEGVVPRVSDNPWIKSIRVGRPSPERTRVVLDLLQSLEKSHYEVKAQGQDIVVMLSENERVETTAELAPAPAPVSPPIEKLPSPNPLAKATLSSSLPKQGKVRVIIDAGHGGEDSGAIGPRGLREKDVTLSVSKRLQARLLKNPKFEVLMTREDDTRLQLGDRTTFANQMQGDLFVSIHANANPKPTARGVSTYFLNNADDHESLRVAMRENGELALPNHAHANNGTVPEAYFLDVMKASLEKNYHTTQSTDLAYEVQKQLVKQLGQRYKDVTDLGVKSAGFYVLTGAKMPAILVETSFISNAVEEQRLKQDRYQEALAEAIYKAVLSYTKLKDKRSHAAL